MTDVTKHHFSALGCSSQKYLLDCPAKYLDYKLNKDFKPTDDMKLGSLLDMFLLEPEKVEQKFMRFPFDKLTGDGKYTTNANKAVRDEAIQEAISKNVELITTKDHWQIAEHTAERIRNEDSLFRHFTEPKTVHVYRQFESENGCPMQGELDIEFAEGSAEDWLIIDIKNSNDISRNKFRRTVQDLHYNTQMAAYQCSFASSHGIKPPVWFLAIDAVRCYDAYLNGLKTKWWTWYQMPQEGWHGLDNGMENHLEACRIFMECNASGEWPAYEYLAEGDWKGLNVNQL